MLPVSRVIRQKPTRQQSTERIFSSDWKMTYQSPLSPWKPNCMRHSHRGFLSDTGKIEFICTFHMPGSISWVPCYMFILLQGLCMSACTVNIHKSIATMLVWCLIAGYIRTHTRCICFSHGSHRFTLMPGSSFFITLHTAIAVSTPPFPSLPTSALSQTRCHGNWLQLRGSER